MKGNKTTDTEDLEDVPALCSQRWILAYIGFLGFSVVYSLKVNISVAVVCMLKPIHPAEIDLNITNFTTAMQTDVACIEKMNEDSHSSDNWIGVRTPSRPFWRHFFYGYIVTQIPGGWIADRYGGKRVLLVTILLSSILTVLMPVCARTSVYLVYTIRMMIGLLTVIRNKSAVKMSNTFMEIVVCYLGSNVYVFEVACRDFNHLHAWKIVVCVATSLAITFVASAQKVQATNSPAMNAMWGRWAQKMERSKLSTFCYAGATFGNVLTFSTSGLLCAYGFDNGWGSIFYVTGVLGILWSLAWFYMTADTPSSHPKIVPGEIKNIAWNVEFDTEKRRN